MNKYSFWILCLIGVSIDIAVHTSFACPVHCDSMEYNNYIIKDISIYIYIYIYIYIFPISIIIINK